MEILFIFVCAEFDIENYLKRLLMLTALTEWAVKGFAFVACLQEEIARQHRFDIKFRTVLNGVNDLDSVERKSAFVEQNSMIIA